MGAARRAHALRGGARVRRERGAVAFRDLRLARVEIVGAADNGPSRRVAEKAGAVLEGLARNRLPIHGVPVTAAAVHSLVPADVPATSA